MRHAIHSIRTFIGAKNFNESREFYRKFGFIESVISEKMSYFYMDHFGFYLQDYYVKKWVNNSMVFLEVDDVDRYWRELNEIKLTEGYKHARLSPIKEYDWGKECFVHDPSGVLWHIGMFN